MKLLELHRVNTLASLYQQRIFNRMFYSARKKVRTEIQLKIFILNI